MPNILTVFGTHLEANEMAPVMRLLTAPKRCKRATGSVARRDALTYAPAAGQTPIGKHTRNRGMAGRTIRARLRGWKTHARSNQRTTCCQRMPGRQRRRTRCRRSAGRNALIGINRHSTTI